MGFDHKSSLGGSRDMDMGFAFNNTNFSDRVLRVEIVADLTEDPPESEACHALTLTDCGAAGKSKSRRGDVREKENGDEAPANRSSDEDGSRVLRVETFHVNSLLLASNSPFFFKLFSNGMLESKKQCVTLRIDASEEAAFMELLNFMYSGTLRVNTTSAVLDVLIVADKFGVVTCMSHCCGFLRDMAITQESALLYLELPTNILRSEAVKPLIDAANQFLAAHYNDISKHKGEVMNLPLVGIESILSSDDLRVTSEDVVYDIALKWTKIHYQKPEERREILSTRLGRYIRFPYMSPQKLRTVLTCDYFNKDFATKAALDALFFKVDNRNRRAVDDIAPASHPFVERAYKYRPIKLLEFELPHQHSVVYLDLKREECAALFLSKPICFQRFLLGGHLFYLTAQYIRKHQCFALILFVIEQGSTTFSFEYEFCARSKPLEEYITMCKSNYDFAVRDATGGNDLTRIVFLFAIPWTSFVADDSPYFINEVFHIRAEITVKR